MCFKKMRLPVYSKRINKDTFEVKHIWDIKKGRYDDGGNQYLVEFEPVASISSINKHYYRFPLYGSKETGKYYWLILPLCQNIRFSIMQYGVLKTLITPLKRIIQIVKDVCGE